jgi:hypothetical protein
VTVEHDALVRDLDVPLQGLVTKDVNCGLVIKNDPGRFNMRLRLLRYVFITYLQLINKCVVAIVIRCVISAHEIKINVQEIKLIDVKPDDSLFGVALLSSVFLGALVGVVVTIITLDI